VTLEENRGLVAGPTMVRIRGEGEEEKVFIELKEIILVRAVRTGGTCRIFLEYLLKKKNALRRGYGGGL